MYEVDQAVQVVKEKRKKELKEKEYFNKLSGPKKEQTRAASEKFLLKAKAKSLGKEICDCDITVGPAKHLQSKIKQERNLDLSEEGARVYAALADFTRKKAAADLARQFGV